MERSYVARNLRKCISYGDILKNPSLHDEDRRQETATSAAIRVDAPNVFNNLLNVITVKSKKAFTVESVENLLILKLLSSNLKNSYRVTVKNRESIVRNLIAFLRESSAYHIHRYDIKSFYESIDRNLLLKDIKDDGILSRISINLLESFFQELDRQSVLGLPRGLGISATLSEIALQQLDRHMKDTDGVFLYERFVDDIILITDNDIRANDSRENLENILPSGLTVHRNTSEKTYFGSVSKPNDKNVGKQNTFSYLGYSYTATEKNHSSDEFLKIKRREIRVDISPDKAKKLKQRIINTFTSYISSRRRPEDYDLLIKRMKFLSGNYYLRNLSNINDVKSGIYYNYRLINQDQQLNELDRFLISLLFNKGSNLSKRIQTAIPLTKRREIAHFSFKKGHDEKRFHRFSYPDFVRIKRAWR